MRPHIIPAAAFINLKNPSRNFSSLNNFNTNPVRPTAASQRPNFIKAGKAAKNAPPNKPPRKDLIIPPNNPPPLTPPLPPLPLRSPVMPMIAAFKCLAISKVLTMNL